MTQLLKPGALQISAALSKAPAGAPQLDHSVCSTGPSQRESSKGSSWLPAPRGNCSNRSSVATQAWRELVAVKTSKRRMRRSSGGRDDDFELDGGNLGGNWGSNGSGWNSGSGGGPWWPGEPSGSSGGGSWDSSSNGYSNVIGLWQRAILESAWCYQVLCIWALLQGLHFLMAGDQPSQAAPAVVARASKKRSSSMLAAAAAAAVPVVPPVLS